MLWLPSAVAPQLSAMNVDTFPHLSLSMPHHQAANKGPFHSSFSPGNISWFPPSLSLSNCCQWALPTGAHESSEIANQLSYPWSLWPLLWGLAEGSPQQGNQRWRPLANQSAPQEGYIRSDRKMFALLFHIRVVVLTQVCHPATR